MFAYLPPLSLKRSKRRSGGLSDQVLYSFQPMSLEWHLDQPNSHKGGVSVSKTYN